MGLGFARLQGRESAALVEPLVRVGARIRVWVRVRARARVRVGLGVGLGSAPSRIALWPLCAVYRPPCGRSTCLVRGRVRGRGRGYGKGYGKG